MRILLASLAIIVAVYVSSAPPAAQRGPAADPLVRENALVKLADHSWVIPDNFVPMVPNVGIIVGSRGTLVIDPGMGRRNAETVLREVAKLSKNAELYVASTHWHIEHTAGIAAFPPTAKHIGSPIQEAEFADGAPAQAGNFGARSPLHAELLRDMVWRKADVPFDREYLLDLGGVRVRMLVVGPTHTRGDTVFFVEGDAVLFAGDVVMNNSFVAATEDSSVKAWLTAYGVLETWRPATIVPAHGAVGRGALIGVNRAFMREIDARARELKGQGRTIDEVETTVQKEMQAKHPTWARVNGAAGAARAAYREAR